MSKKNSSINNKGIAMLTAIIFLAIMTVIMGIGTVVGLSNYRLAKDNKATIQAEHAADSGIERTLFEFWHLPNFYAEQNGYGSQVPIAAYKGILDGNIDLGVDLPVITAGENSTFGEGVSLSGALDNGALYEAVVRRKDIGNNVLLNVVAKGLIGNSERYVSQTLTFGSANPWDFAILTDNIDCALCHLEVYSIETGYKENGELRDFFNDDLSDIHGEERVKVGSLSALKVKDPYWADTYILGTLYTAEDSDFTTTDTTVFTSSLQENTSLISSGSNFDSTFQQIRDWDRVTNAIQDCETDECSAFAQMYTHYPDIEQGQPDGLLQNSFPLPVPDENNDRLIDNREWDDVINGSGKVSVTRNSSPSDILKSVDSAGIILVPYDKQLGEISTSNQNFESRNAKSSFGGHHAILRGTADSPLEFDGKVYINGDVVISGRVTGDGMVIARGNIYIVGDIVYDCGNSPCDYTQPHTLPRFALSAVGNITTGIYGFESQGHRQSAHENSGGTSWATTTAYLQGGVLSDRFAHQDYGTPAVDNIRSLSAMLMTDFNQSEYERALANSLYVPRLYIYRQGQHDWIYRCERRCDQYTSRITNLHGPLVTAKSLDGSEMDGLQVSNGTYDIAKDLDVLNRAVFISLSPKDHWLLGGYEIEDANFIQQFPTANCADVQGYIDNILFNPDIDKQNRRVYTDAKNTLEEDCYNEAVARERLRAMNNELVLREMWKTYVEDRNARKNIINEAVDGDAFRLDGIVYTSNAFFFLSPRRAATRGQALVNGAFITADMGALVAGYKTDHRNTLKIDSTREQEGGGFRLQYDRRLIDLISGVGESISISKSSFEIITANEAQQLLEGP